MVNNMPSAFLSSIYGNGGAPRQTIRPFLVVRHGHRSVRGQRSERATSSIPEQRQIFDGTSYIVSACGCTGTPKLSSKRGEDETKVGDRDTPGMMAALVRSTKTSTPAKIKRRSICQQKVPDRARSCTGYRCSLVGTETILRSNGWWLTADWRSRCVPCARFLIAHGDGHGSTSSLSEAFLHHRIWNRDARRAVIVFHFSLKVSMLFGHNGL